MTDVHASAMLTATGQVQEATGTSNLKRARVKGLHCVASVAGTLTFRNGGGSGAVHMTIAVPVGVVTIDLPGCGILFSTDVHVTITDATVSGLTVFYT